MRATKAFDKVGNSALIHKLNILGVPRAPVRWVTSFLINRTQSVVIGLAKSESRPVLSGVPQGSVLGPLLFVLYSDDIDKVIRPEVKIRKYADDIKLFCAYAKGDENVAQEAMQSTLVNVHRWSEVNGLPINISKSCCMYFGSKNRMAPYQLGHCTLAAKRSQRDLGVDVNDCVKFGDHIRRIVLKARSVTGRIFRCFTSRSPSVILPLFNVLVRPILEYASPVWNPSLVKHIKAVESVQRNVTKRLCGLQKLPYADRIRVLGISTLRARRDYLDLVEMYKLIHGYTICGHVPMPVHTVYAIRGHRYRLKQCRCILNSRRFSFFVRVVKLWNSLPEKIVDAKSLALFKSNLRRYMHV